MLVSDEILVKKSQKGDYPSFEELVKRYEKKIYNLAYRIMGNKEDASDVLQETFLQAFRKLAGFKGKAKFSTWLYRIAVNICLMKKRKGKRIETVSLDIPILTKEEDEIKRELRDDWSESPLATLENEEVKKNLSKAIDSLPEEYKTVFLLRGLNGLSNEEVANVLKISLPAVKSRLHRARLFLRDKLSQYFQGYGSRG
ncbi:sigma-70 family RNA polymerase sigma factor [bacterium]|nr:sigma-70 family RNA polymerase sigma factor [bacterium]NIN92716.1 sigma-70 family RNA polymerase sigma factor [bacterium]NIO18697.1 sigma-70 family RNA polymerase sigma factor [bacterium]NIO73773.1 sigma-70 family RNA polymerase sigma factor [bacterium]